MLRAIAAVLLAMTPSACAGGVSRPAADSSPTPPIVFAADRAPELSGRIYRLDAEGHRIELSTGDSALPAELPLVTPDGTSVSFFRESRENANVYLIGIDGRNLRQLSSPHIETDLGISVAWSPDSRALAVVSGNLDEQLSVVGPGRAPKVITKAPYLYDPSWSPDSRLLTVQTSARVIQAFTSDGKLAWQVPAPSGPIGWSARGSFAALSRGSITVYDEQGEPRFRVRGRAGAWSPDGRWLASVARGDVEIRNHTGRLVLHKAIRGLAGRRAGLAWGDSRRVLVGIFPHTPGHDVPGIDVVTGKSIRGSFRYFFEPRSPDGKLLADTRQHGAGFDVRVSPLAGGRARVYGRVPGCRNEESFGSGIDSLQFVPGRRSLVYQSECYLPFASLYAIEPNGTGLRRLTHDSGDAVGPKWSPDGTRILYAQFDGNPTECKGCSGQTWIVNADGSELVAQRQALPLRRDEHQRAAEALRLPRRGRHAARPAHPRRCPRLGAVADRLRRHLGLALDGEARRNRPQEGGRARRGAGVVA